MENTVTHTVSGNATLGNMGNEPIQTMGNHEPGRMLVLWDLSDHHAWLESWCGHGVTPSTHSFPPVLWPNRDTPAELWIFGNLGQQRAIVCCT